MARTDALVSIRCADDSRQIALDPIGSAVFFHEAVVVETPLPWPKPVFEHQWLASVPELVERAGAQGRTVRVLAAVPSGDPASPGCRVVVHRRPPAPWIGPFQRSEYLVPDAELPDELERLIVDREPSPDWQVAPTAQRDLLLCTQGSHDPCCGRYGMNLHGEIADRWPGVRVTRVSHTGGHRFAPTGISFPDGRYWGYLDVERCDAIVDHTQPMVAVAGSLRGACGVDSGFAQAAERAVFAELGWDWDLRRRRLTLVEGDDRRATVLVESTDAAGDDPTRHTAEVVVTRIVPVITCGSPGGLPHTKDQSEFAVVSLSRER